MRFINSSEIDNINGIECLHLYLKDDYSYKIKIDGEEVLQNEIYIKAPTMSNEDLSNIRKCSSVLSKFEEIQNEKTLKELSKLTHQERERLFSELKDENIDQIKAEDVIRDHVSNLIKNSKSYETKESDYFQEFDKISHFLEKRLNRILDDQLYTINFSIFNEYLAVKQFIIEEIFIEYVAFFFKHFPLESLFTLTKK